MELSELTKLKGNAKKAKRVGRGVGSGKGGHTTGRGNKGQKARTGKKPWAGFEGGQTPLYKRMPLLGGFKRYYAPKVIGINIQKLGCVEDSTEVTPQKLRELRIVRSKSAKRVIIKLLGYGTIAKKLTFRGFQYSASARKTIEESGSKILE